MSSPQTALRPNTITVSLKNTVFGGMSDGDGNFEFAATPGRIYDGRPIRNRPPQGVSGHHRNRRENVFPNIEVKEDINQLEEVVVTGQFSPQSMKNSLYKVRSVNSDQIRQKAPLDVQSLLNTEIGIRLSNDMALGETDFELMGMSGNNVKILMDGIPMIDRGSTKQSLSQLDVNRIERVEIVEGPMSVVYGTDALAGVINIITKKGPGYSGESTWRVGARIQEETMGKEYQFFNGEGLHNESIDLGFNLKNGLYFNGGYTRNDNGGWQGDLTGREKRWHPKDQSLANGMIGFQRRNLNVWYRLDFLDEKIFGPLNGTAIEPEKVSDKGLSDQTIHPSVTGRLETGQPVERQSRPLLPGLQAPHADHLDRPLDRREMALGRRCQSGCHPVQSLDRTGDGNLEYRPEDQPSARFGIPMDRRQGRRIDGTPTISDLAFFISAEYKPWSWTEPYAPAFGLS